jgi:hypothetical protein
MYPKFREIAYNCIDIWYDFSRWNIAAGLEKVACIRSQLALDGLEIPDNVCAVSYCPYRFRLNSRSHVARRQPGNLGERERDRWMHPADLSLAGPLGFYVQKRFVRPKHDRSPCAGIRGTPVICSPDGKHLLLWYTVTSTPLNLISSTWASNHP